MPQQPDQRGPTIFLVLLLIVALLVVAWGVGQEDARSAVEQSSTVEPSPSLVERSPVVEPVETPAPTQGGDPAHRRAPSALPGGGTKVFGGNHVLVAYYGTGQTASMGVLGESDPDTMDRRLHRAAQPFGAPDRSLRHVYELIVTVADGHPGPDGDYSHDLPRSVVETYVRAAHRNHALLLLDLQPGRSGFLEVAKRWTWALRDPWVGLALDPEWRMGPRQVPARAIGQVRAAEVNRTSAWLTRLTRSAGLPEKLFVLHQFRSDMVQGIGEVRRRPGLAMVQHVDGFGTRHQKRATYAAVARGSSPWASSCSTTRTSTGWARARSSRCDPGCGSSASSDVSTGGADRRWRQRGLLVLLGDDQEVSYRSSTVKTMPRGKPSPKVAITVDPDVYARVVEDARRQGVSVSAWMTEAARRSLKIQRGLAAVAEWEAENGAFTEEELAAAGRRVQESMARWAERDE